MKNRIHVQAHRGAKKEAGENNIPSIQCAAQMGVDSIEIDVQLTRDGYPILVHDFFLNGKLISEIDRNELSPFPLLEAVFHSFNPDTRSKIQWLDIEIKREKSHPKSPSIEELVDRVLHVTKTHWNFEKVAFRSFDWDVLYSIREREPECRVIPLLEKGTKDFSAALKMKTLWVAPCFSDLTPTYVSQAHAKKIKVMPYTVNDPADWKKLVDWGIDGVTTDDPRNLLNFLEGLN